MTVEKDEKRIRRLKTEVKRLRKVVQANFDLYHEAQTEKEALRAERDALRVDLAMATVPRVKGVCPACSTENLFLGASGHVTCGYARCWQPDLVSDLLMDGCGRA